MTQLAFTDTNGGGEEIACPRCGNYGVQPSDEPFYLPQPKQGGWAIPFRCDGCESEGPMLLTFKCSGGSTMVDWELS